MTLHGALPEPNDDGFLPVRYGAAGAGAMHKCSLAAFAERFCTSPRRVEIFGGYLRFRHELRRIGLSDGFQWLDGSYVTPKVDPGDIDVVTFTWGKQVVCEPHAIIRTQDPKLDSKEVYMVDSHFVDLDEPGDYIAQYSAYWHELWSSRKGLPGSRKGFAMVDLAESLDDAESALAAILQAGVQP